MDQVAPPLFSVDSARVSFGSKSVMVSGSFWVNAGRKTVLVGRNGCGKSTLLKVGTGQVRSAAGIVRCGGWRGRRPRWHLLARMGVFLWSDKAMLPLDESVSRVFETVSHHLPAARIEEAIEICRLGELMTHRTGQLSGGERRRVELGIAVARNPSVLLADEPFLGVMPTDRKFIIDVFDLLAKRGAGVLVTGHEVATLFDLADDVIWMTAGTTHHLGTARQAASHDQFQREYLGPQALGLARS